MLTAEYEVLKEIFHLHGTALIVAHQIVPLYFMMPKILTTLIQWVVKTVLEVYIQMSAKVNPAPRTRQFIYSLRTVSILQIPAFIQLEAGKRHPLQK